MAGTPFSNRSTDFRNASPTWQAAVLLVCGLAAVAVPRHARAVEEDERFLAGLRERRLYDVALDYVRILRADPQLPSEKAPLLDFEEARLLMDSGLESVDVSARKKFLDRAGERFQAFLNDHPTHPLASMARTQVGQVLVERAKTLLVTAARPSQAERKPALVAQARELFQQAQPIFLQAEEEFAARLQQFPKAIDPQNTQQLADREQARTDLIHARLFSAQILSETAASYPPGSPESQELYTSAAGKYRKIHEAYRRVSAGVTAHVREAECYQNLGDRRQALAIYSQILLNDSAGLRPHKAIALHLAMLCWLHPETKKPDEALIEGQKWLAEVTGSEAHTPDGLAIRFLTAQALRAKAEGLPAAEVVQGRELLAQARKLAAFVARWPGAYRDDARALAQALAGNDTPGAQPTNFAEALDAGRQRAESYEGLGAALAGTELDEAARAQVRQQTQIALDDSIRLLRLALSLREAETPLEDLNTARYYLSFLYYQAGRMYDAAILGEFLAQNYPQSAGSRQAAKIALYAYRNGAISGGPTAAFDRGRMRAVADDITRIWPGEADADEAWIVLMAVAIEDGQLAQAAEYLAKIPAESPRRGDAEMQAGQALRGEYLRLARREEASRPPQAELDALLARAQETLTQGLAKGHTAIEAGGDVTPALVRAALALAEINLNAGHPDQAVALLTDPRTGPFALATAKSPLVADAHLAIESHKMALRAFVGTQALDQAEKVMDDLEKLVSAGGDAQAADALTQIYVALGRELEEQMELLKQRKNGPELEKVTHGFELFLDRISARTTGNTFGSRSWVASTYYSLGNGYMTGGNKPSEKAKGYFDKAIQNYEALLAAASADASVTPDGLLAVRLRLATCHRRLGQYKTALAHLEEVLKQKPVLVDAQKEAALTYQEWGSVNEGYFTLAIAGARKQPTAKGRQENLIWGWNMLSIKVQREPKFEANFHEARYNLAKCRLAQSIQRSEPERTSGLKQAQQDILITARLKPQMGGDDWRRKYNDLLKTIQRAANLPETGLPEPRAASKSVAAPTATAR